MATGTFERTMNTVAYGVVGAVAARHTANGLAFELSADWRRRVTLEAVAAGYGGYRSAPARLAALLGERRAALAQVERSPIERGEQERLKTEVDAVVRSVVEDLDGQVQAGFAAAAARLELALVAMPPGRRHPRQHLGTFPAAARHRLKLGARCQPGGKCSGLSRSGGRVAPLRGRRPGKCTGQGANHASGS